MYRTIVDAVWNHSVNKKDKLAIGFKNTEITYGMLGEQMIKCADILYTRYEIRNRDKIMLSAVSKPEYVVVLLALQFLGAISVPVDKAALEDNIADVYHFNSSKLIFTDTKISDKSVIAYSLSGLYQEVLKDSYDEKELTAAADRLMASYHRQQDGDPSCEDDIAEMLFTTGTTGRPKGAMLSYGNIYASTHNTWTGVGMQEDDIVLIPLPLNHSVGMRVLRTVLYIGASMVIQNGFTFPRELRTNMEAFSCTGFVCVPAVIERLYRQMGADFKTCFSPLRYMEIGAGSLSIDSKKKLTDILPDTKIYNTWGSTETGGAIFLEVSKYHDKFASLGRPVNGIRVKIIDENGNEIQASDINTAGRMALTGPMIMKGYYNLKEQTEQSLQNGWLVTNDLVYQDSDGFFYMLGRADDIINVGGEKVSPIEVENLASQHPSIFECACIGIPDPEGILGQVPALIYVPEEGENPTEKELLRVLTSSMESYKLPRQFLKIEELPRNRMKKLDRKALFRIWEDSRNSKQEEEGNDPLADAVIRNILGRKSIRTFTDRPIDRAIMSVLIDCAIQAPTANNMQTWRFVVIQDKNRIAALKETISEVISQSEDKKVKFYGFNNPDTLVLITNDRRNVNGAADCMLASENLMLAANAYGIGSVLNNSLRTVCGQETIRTMLSDFGVSKKHDVYAMICLGYPDGKTKPIARRKDIVTYI